MAKIFVKHGSKEILELDIDEDQVDQTMDTLHFHPTLVAHELDQLEVHIHRTFIDMS